MFQTTIVEIKHISCSIIFFPPKIMPFIEVIWKNIIELGRHQITIWPVYIACCICKATILRICNT